MARLNHPHIVNVLVEEAPLVPLGYGRFHMLMKPWVKKLATLPLKW